MTSNYNKQTGTNTLMKGHLYSVHLFQGSFTNDEVQKYVEEAIDLGYRHLDTAYLYHRTASRAGSKKQNQTGGDPEGGCIYHIKGR